MFRSKNFSGLDMNGKQVFCAAVKIERGLPVLQEICHITLKDEIVSGGRISQTETISSELANALRKGVLSKNIHIAIPTQNILVRKIVSLPDVEKEELGKLLEFQIGESIHLPFEEPVYDFVKIGSIMPNAIRNLNEELSLDELAKGIEENLEGPKSEVILFAASKTLAADLAEVCISAGLKPLSAEVRALALQRLLLYVHPMWLKETEMILDVAEDSIEIHIFKENKIIFSRMMSINQNVYSFNQENTPSLSSETLILDEDKTLSFESNKEIAASTDGSKYSFEESFLDEIIREIERAQNFFRYSLNERDSDLKRIIVTGKKTNQVLKPLKERLGSELVVRIDYSSILADSFKSESLLDACSVAIGLALRAKDH
ncbi:type IV pilus biogenesis protein PilM [Cytobacillus sp. NCCP-133]|uniref:type IV pilus biogenesis protein PilM n=1 Tax=Cytobacillus sp. NCCP-133 TaxID=766848 RepID=UPI0022309DB3|nr:hypothetical protein [Cytobacillus sp. NCCP-133]GLB58378.1 hypothetical protein NCCP133_05110 [Cytobacillus sp. NCCP-133]